MKVQQTYYSTVVDFTCNCTVVARHLEEGTEIPDEDLCDLHDVEMAPGVVAHPYG